MNPFNLELNELIRKSGKSANEVAEHGRIDRAYLHRLLIGERSNPSPETLVRLWIGVIFDERMLVSEPELVYGLERLTLAAMWNTASHKLVTKAGAKSS